MKLTITVTVFPFAVHKYLGGRYFETMLILYSTLKVHSLILVFISISCLHYLLQYLGVCLMVIHISFFLSTFNLIRIPLWRREVSFSHLFIWLFIPVWTHVYYFVPWVKISYCHYFAQIVSGLPFRSSFRLGSCVLLMSSHLFLNTCFTLWNHKIFQAHLAIF